MCLCATIHNLTHARGRNITWIQNLSCLFILGIFRFFQVFFHSNHTFPLPLVSPHLICRSSLVSFSGIAHTHTHTYILSLSPPKITSSRACSLSPIAAQVALHSSSNPLRCVLLVFHAILAPVWRYTQEC